MCTDFIPRIICGLGECIHPIIAVYGGVWLKQYNQACTASNSLEKRGNTNASIGGRGF
jgi:hypothetical protein